MAARPTTSRVVRCVAPVGAALGEGPLWIAAENTVYWVDILGGKLFRHFPASARTEVCTPPTPLTSLIPTRDGRLLCTGWQGIHAFDPRSGAFVDVLRLDIDAHTLRINDGCCHPDGSFWFGTMDLAERHPFGDFYRLSALGACDRFAAAFAITNGPAFTPAGDRGYFVDTLHRRILYAAMECGVLNGPLHLFAQIPAADGYPDGLAIDDEGGVWCAHWSGARITRFDAGGRISEMVHLPVSNVTKCAFGGARLNRLFITTARNGLDADALRAQPQAGGLFEVEVDYRGTAPAEYRGSVRNDATMRTCFFEIV